MFSFSDLSLSAASRIGDVANIGLIVSLVMGVVSTFLVVKTTEVKEQYWEKAREQSNLQISELSTQGEQLRRDTAEANARALEAKLELERFKAPRLYSENQLRSIYTKVIGFSGQEYVLSLGLGNEAFNFITQINNVLKAAGWKKLPPLGPVTAMAGEASATAGSGVGIQFSITATEATRDAALKLAQAISEEGVLATAEVSADKAMADKTTLIQVVVGTKE